VDDVSVVLSRSSWLAAAVALLGVHVAAPAHPRSRADWNLPEQRLVVRAALGDGWVTHSSDQGVYVLPLRTRLAARAFAWARRVL
jgi:hypothetical protein